jgi:hypothetical protein
MAGTFGYAVVMTRDQRVDVFEAAGPVAERVGMPEVDVRLRLRKSRGILWNGLTRDNADALAETFSTLGYDVDVREEASLYAYPRTARRVLELEFRDQEIWFRTSLQDEFVHLEATDVLLISAGVYETPAYRDYIESDAFKQMPAIYKLEDPEDRGELTAALARRSQRRESQQIDPTKKLGPDEARTLYREQTDGFVDLLLTTAPGLLRVHRSDALYAVLGDRNAGNTLDNFRILTGDLVERLPDTPLTPMTRLFLDGESIHELLFYSPDELRRYNRWFCTVHAIDPEGKAWDASPDGERKTEVEVTCPTCGQFHPVEETNCPYCYGIAAEPEDASSRLPLLLGVFLLLVLAAGWQAYTMYVSGIEERAIRMVQNALQDNLSGFVEEAGENGWKVIGFYADWQSEGTVRVWFTWVNPADAGTAPRRANWSVDVEAGTFDALDEEAERIEEELDARSRVEDRLSRLADKDVRIERIDVTTGEAGVEVRVLYLLPLDRTLYTAAWSVSGDALTAINEDATRLDGFLRDDE